MKYMFRIVLCCVTHARRKNVFNTNLLAHLILVQRILELNNEGIEKQMKIYLLTNEIYLEMMLTMDKYFS